jgi:hypothetical protein
MDSSTSETPEEVIELLNKVDQGYIGLTKPKIEHIDESQQDYLPGDTGY